MIATTFNELALSKLTLTEALSRIDQTCNINKILKEFDRDFLVPYYTHSDIGYRTYHSEEDSIHMAINSEDKFDPEGYYTQPKWVEQHIQNLGAKSVLELGCGKGFNSIFLAERNPQTQFVGLDLTPLHIKLARKRAANFSNLTLQVGNFNDIPYEENSFDLVFAVECLCHSTDINQTLRSIKRVLKPGGRVVVFDGYRSYGSEQQTTQWQKAQKLAEIAMAVQGGMNSWQKWLDSADAVGLQLIEERDLSAEVRPTLERLQHISFRFFKLHPLVRKPVWISRHYLVMNAIAGLLMPFCVDAKLAQYSLSVMEG